MRYRTIILIFAGLYLLPIAAVGFLVYNRIQQRQITLQLYLQNQLEVDRQILVTRDKLVAIQMEVRNFLLMGTHPLSESRRSSVVADVQNTADKLNVFWKKYKSQYLGVNRPFLINILKNTQEEDLLEKEAGAVNSVEKRTGEYISDILAHPDFAGETLVTDAGARAVFLSQLDEKRNTILDSLNELADVRYIFSQRIVFFISGENDRQQGFFNTAFVFLFAVTLIAVILEHFYIHKPFQDIISFLQDLYEGKRGQRLYFSSPVREIKQSEEIINEFVGQAEEHAEEKL